MCASLRTDLRSLTPEQTVTLRQYAERWVAIRRSTQPSSRRAAETGVRVAYIAAGLDPPRRIAWCNGPIELANSTMQVARTEGADIGSVLIRDTQIRLTSAIKRRVHKGVLSEIANAFRSDAATTAVSNAVARNIGRQRLSISARLRWAFSLLDARGSFADLNRRIIGQHELAWLGTLRVLARCLRPPRGDGTDAWSIIVR